MTEAFDYYQQLVRPVEPRPSQPVVWFDTPTPLANACRCKASTTTRNERSIIVPCVETAGVDGFCPRCRVECTQPEEKAA